MKERNVVLSWRSKFAVEEDGDGNYLLFVHPLISSLSILQDMHFSILDMYAIWLVEFSCLVFKSEEEGCTGTLQPLAFLNKSTSNELSAWFLSVITWNPFHFTRFSVAALCPWFWYSVKSRVSRYRFPSHGIHPAVWMKSANVDSVMIALEYSFHGRPRYVSIWNLKGSSNFSETILDHYTSCLPTITSSMCCHCVLLVGNLLIMQIKL